MKKFYVTTPIFYVNDKPHLGHAFATTAADILARWHRLRGERVFFITGTDEHGEKNQKAAEAKGQTPQEYVDELSIVWKELWKKLDISYDDFIRTSEERHIIGVKNFIKKLREASEIYEGDYQSWYCVSDESFFTDFQLKDGKCPECGRDVKWLTEKGYFFKLSHYEKDLLKFYKANPTFLSPEFRADEIKNRVKSGLKDLSITRQAVTWGIPFQANYKLTVYVWVEALLNYITVLGWPAGSFDEWWPADVHLVGKEINWFHSVIWPAMLMAAGIEPPKKVFAHGWWTVNGKKMGKSVGNAIDPAVIVDKYSVDAFRYFLIREKPLGEDGDFSEKALISRINGELVADLGNLFYRTLTLAEKFDGRIEGIPELNKHLDIKKIDQYIDDVDLFNAINEIWAFIRACNKYVNDKEPWKLQGKELSSVLYNLLEACRIISILISPFMPETSEKMNEQLGVKAGSLNSCIFTTFTGKPHRGAYLFKKVEV